jgi:hypothetical protein
MRGSFPSTKSIFAPYRREVDADCLALLEADPRVRRIALRPCEVEFWAQSEWRSWIPDFRVTRIDGESLVAIDTASLRRRHPHYDDLRQAAAELGYRCDIEAPEQIRRQPRLTNVRDVLLANRHSVRRQVHDHVLHQLISGPKFLGDLVARAPTGTTRLDIFALHLQAVLQIELESILDAHTVVALPDCRR